MGNHRRVQCDFSGCDIRNEYRNIQLLHQQEIHAFQLRRCCDIHIKRHHSFHYSLLEITLLRNGGLFAITRNSPAKQHISLPVSKLNLMMPRAHFRSFNVAGNALMLVMIILPSSTATRRAMFTVMVVVLGNIVTCESLREIRRACHRSAAFAELTRGAHQFFCSEQPNIRGSDLPQYEMSCTIVSMHFCDNISTIKSDIVSASYLCYDSERTVP